MNIYNEKSKMLEHICVTRYNEIVSVRNLLFKGAEAWHMLFQHARLFNEK